MEAMDSCENAGPLDVSIKKENTQDEGTVKPKMDDKYCAQFNNNGQVVEALKARIRELESMSKTGSDKFTCLLCKVSTPVKSLFSSHYDLSVVRIIRYPSIKIGRFSRDTTDDRRVTCTIRCMCPLREITDAYQMQSCLPHKLKTKGHGIGERGYLDLSVQWEEFFTSKMNFYKNFKNSYSV